VIFKRFFVARTFAIKVDHLRIHCWSPRFSICYIYIGTSRRIFHPVNVELILSVRASYQNVYAVYINDNSDNFHISRMLILLILLAG